MATVFFLLFLGVTIVQFRMQESGQLPRLKRVNSDENTASYLLIPILASSVPVLPFVWMLSASLKTNVQVFSSHSMDPKDPQSITYHLVKIKFGLYYFNTIKLTVIVT